MQSVTQLMQEYYIEPNTFYPWPACISRIAYHIVNYQLLSQPMDVR